MNSVIHRLINSSPSVSCLQHSHILDHWAVQNCLAELIGDSLTAHFIAFGSTSFKASCTEQRPVMPIRRLAKWDSSIRRLSFLVLFGPFCSVLCLSFHASSKTSNT
uniref:Uncharacterized protein n=1 Tax=Solanum tuberosum TaxID=4113 RepID=M1DEF7_SOLTU